MVDGEIGDHKCRYKIRKAASKHVQWDRRFEERWWMGQSWHDWICIQRL